MAAGTTLLTTLLTFGVISQVTAVPRNIVRDKTGICKRYGMACPVDKTCMIQRIDWPRPMRLPVCVSAKFAPAHMKACYQPPERGPCAAEFIRWHYNVQANQCSWFYFGGCAGNRNNFFSKEACERACLGDSVVKDKENKNAKDLPKTAAQIRAEEFMSRPKPEFQELRSQIETVINGRPKGKSRKYRRNGKGRRRKYRNRTERVVFVNKADDQWPSAYRKTMRRGELFKLFSVLNRGHF